MLSRNDIRREAAPLYNKAGEVEGVPVIHHDIFSNGIVYLGLLFDVKDIPAEDIPYLTLLKRVLGYVDTGALFVC